MPNGVEFTDNSDEVLRMMEGATESAARIIGGLIVGYAKQKLDGARGPKGGRWNQEDIIGLKNSLTLQVEPGDNGPALSVGSNMQIAPYIELGTGKEYNPPQAWIEYHGSDGHTKAGIDSWIYRDELTGETKVGLPVAPTPYLYPAVMDHVDEYRQIIESEMRDQS